jgi:EAL domain-containing protein (putative c-di-GMP-specific phosphodiesterase class I)/CheY-like chemotaxis protein
MPPSHAAFSEPPIAGLDPRIEVAATPFATQSEGALGIDTALLGDRLLVVDHEFAVGVLAEDVAKGVGFKVIRTKDASIVLQTVRTWKPTVLMLDLRTDGTDGIELLRGLAEEACTAHVILVSGANGKIMEAALQLGRERGLKMGGFLLKPIQPETMRQLLTRLISGTSRLVDDFAEAMKTDQLFLEYQLTLDCRLKRVSGVEALVRWDHPVLGIIQPDRFIPLAEASDVIHELTDWVFMTAIKQMVTWLADNPALEVSVNISAKNLEDLGLPDRLQQHCRTAGIECTLLTLELTETGAMREPVPMMDVLTRLRLKGFKLSIDDFGTGFSSLVQLQQMPFSEVKIDRSFVTQMMSNEGCKAIVEIVINLAGKLGLKCVAEGVEDEATLRCLIALGCDAVQGYHLSRPLAPSRIPAFICDYQLMRSAIKVRKGPAASPFTNVEAWLRRKPAVRVPSASSPSA